MMKRICMVVISLSLLLMLSGCRHTPNNITFMEGVGNIRVEDITKVTIRNGNENGELRETNNNKKITNLLNSLSDQTFTRDADQSPRDGWSYYIDLYTANGSGWVRYTYNTGFNSYEGYKGKVIDGRYLADDPEEVKSILEDFFNQLEAQPDQQ